MINERIQPRSEPKFRKFRRVKILPFPVKFWTATRGSRYHESTYENLHHTTIIGKIETFNPEKFQAEKSKTVTRKHDLQQDEDLKKLVGGGAKLEQVIAIKSYELDDTPLEGQTTYFEDLGYEIDFGDKQKKKPEQLDTVPAFLHAELKKDANLMEKEGGIRFAREMHLSLYVACDTVIGQVLKYGNVVRRLTLEGVTIEQNVGDVAEFGMESLEYLKLKFLKFTPDFAFQLVRACRKLQELSMEAVRLNMESDDEDVNLDISSESLEIIDINKCDFDSILLNGVKSLDHLIVHQCNELKRIQLDQTHSLRRIDFLGNDYSNFKFKLGFVKEIILSQQQILDGKLKFEMINIKQKYGTEAEAKHYYYLDKDVRDNYFPETEKKYVVYDVEIKRKQKICDPTMCIHSNSEDKIVVETDENGVTRKVLKIFCNDCDQEVEQNDESEEELYEF